MVLSAEQSLNALISQLQTAGSSHFIDNITKLVVETTPFECSMIGLFDQPESPKKVTVVSGFWGKKKLDNFTYDLEHTPCGNLISKDTCFFESNVGELFPLDKMLAEMGFSSYYGVRYRSPDGKLLGIFIGLSTQPIYASENFLKIFEIFADKISIELTSIVRPFFYQQAALPEVNQIINLFKEDKIEDSKKRFSGEITENRKILCVDDEPFILEIWTEIFDRTKFSVTCASDPHFAIDIFKSDPNRFDGVITDYQMPKLDGIALASEVRKMNPTMPILFCTGSIDVLRKKLSPSLTVNSDIMEKECFPELSERIDRLTTNYRNFVAFESTELTK